MEKLIIYGGSFDPIHNAHLRIAEAAALTLKGDVIFVPAKKMVWKDAVATDKDRLNMLKLALASEGSSAFSISLTEYNRPGKVSYSIDTVKEFKKKYKNRELYFLLGGDEVNSFPKWKEPDEIARLAKIIYADRPDIKIDQAVVKAYNMTSLNYDKSGIVSSESTRNLSYVDSPARVLDYIESHNLYYMAKISPLLREKRLLHSISVAHLSYAIASKNHLQNPGNAYIAGILHDIGKNVSPEESRLMMKDIYPEFVSYPNWCLHQFVGRIMAENDFGITNGEILDAIEYHCSGKAHMPPLGKIVYSADKIDPTRGWNSKSLIRQCLDDYYLGFLAVLKANRKFLVEEKGEFDMPLTEDCYREYLGGK